MICQNWFQDAVEDSNENVSLHLHHATGEDDENIDDYFENDTTDAYFGEEEINDESREPEHGGDHVKGDEETVQLPEKSSLTGTYFV